MNNLQQALHSGQQMLNEPMPRLSTRIGALPSTSTARNGGRRRNRVLRTAAQAATGLALVGAGALAGSYAQAQSNKTTPQASKRPVAPPSTSEDVRKWTEKFAELKSKSVNVTLPNEAGLYVVSAQAIANVCKNDSRLRNGLLKRLLAYAYDDNTFNGMDDQTKQLRKNALQYPLAVQQVEDVKALLKDLSDLMKKLPGAPVLIPNANGEKWELKPLPELTPEHIEEAAKCLAEATKQTMEKVLTNWVHDAAVLCFSPSFTEILRGSLF